MGSPTVARGRRKFSRWHSKIAAPPFPEGSFRVLSRSFIINNVILPCIPAFVHTRSARCFVDRLAHVVESSHCGARLGHTWLHRVYTVPTPSPFAPPCVSTPTSACVQPFGDDSRDLRDLCARARALRRDARRQGSPRRNAAPLPRTEGPRRLRRRSVDSARRRRLAADSAHSTSERTGAADSRGTARPRAAIRRPHVTSPRRALVTPTYSPPRTLPRSSSWCFHSSS